MVRYLCALSTLQHSQLIPTRLLESRINPIARLPNNVPKPQKQQETRQGAGAVSLLQPHHWLPCRQTPDPGLSAVPAGPGAPSFVTALFPWPPCLPSLLSACKREQRTNLRLQVLCSLHPTPPPSYGDTQPVRFLIIHKKHSETCRRENVKKSQFAKKKKGPICQISGT